MNKLLSYFDKGVEKIINLLATISMVIILAVVFLQVVARKFHFSIGGLEELPTYMMLVVTWLTASMLVKKKNQISLNLINVFIKNGKILAFIKIFTYIVVDISICILAYLMYNLAMYNFSMNYMTSSLRMPYGLLMLLVCFSCLVMIVYYTKDIITTAKEVKQWK
ncbi:TRAP-type C4-dicarboxylate transport system, small permease component [Anaerovirgula multivorans]|uniref:TRAP-type C4-dicarboxylate transport system, small permease component n=1 Tax=Anaerovirgula multivorans TaxID=312168 RepID=A0A239K3M6_9FIRM|nr:TRAP transporter small permease [Anaerovirgula multivorans]SNT12272.1 TRAP-type C4-dicarboxylate transport system, small permease component [Anaerovirgula multivorans]